MIDEEDEGSSNGSSIVHDQKQMEIDNDFS